MNYIAKNLVVCTLFLSIIPIKASSPYEKCLIRVEKEHFTSLQEAKKDQTSCLTQCSLLPPANHHEDQCFKRCDKQYEMAYQRAENIYVQQKTICS